MLVGSETVLLLEARNILEGGEEHLGVAIGVGGLGCLVIGMTTGARPLEELFSLLVSMCPWSEPAMDTSEGKLVSDTGRISSSE